MNWKTELDGRYNNILKKGTARNIDDANNIILNASDKLNQIFEKTKEKNNFWSLELTDENYKDLQTWARDEDIVGIVDKTLGGIIGYIHRVHADEILKILNGEKNGY